MKKSFSLFLALLFLFVSVPAARAAETSGMLAENGRTAYRIVLSGTASAAERTAAQTLADYLGQITGASFPVVTDDAAPAEKEIAVGATNRDIPALGDRAAMDDDAVRILTAGERLYLTGGAARGALYAVYTFLEDWLGCRWFTHELTVVPRQSGLALPDIDYFYEPCFRLRQTFWSFSTGYADFCAAHKLHGVMAYLPDELGGGRYELAVSSVHTMQQFVPQSLFAEHPEYFGSDASGTRSPNRQPCLSNAEVFRLAVAWAKAYFAQNNAILSVSQNDGMDFCRCEACSAFNAAHGGTDSAALLDFVNRVASEVKKDYPAARVETLAYQNSQKPPAGLQVGEDVVIRLCAMNTCTLHALDDASCTPNKTFAADLAGWAALTDNIYIWDYSTNFQYYYAIYPNLTALQGRFRYYRDNNVTAIFDNGCGDLIAPGEFHELRVYLLLKLMWDPDTDVERHMREFCAAYYGAAAEDVLEFLRYYEANCGGWNAKAVRVCHNSCQDGGVGLVNNTALSAANVKQLDKLMQSAQARSLSAEEARRLEGLSLSWRFTKNALFKGEFNWYSGLTDPEAATRQLAADMRVYGVTALSEAGALWLLDTDPDGRMMPTFWYKDEAELGADVLREMRVRVFIHKLLYTVCTPVRMVLDLTQ